MKIKFMKLLLLTLTAITFQENVWAYHKPNLTNRMLKESNEESSLIGEITGVTSWDLGGWVYGWVYDSENPDETIEVYLYTDGPNGDLVFIEKANTYYNVKINGVYRSCGFGFLTPLRVKDNQTHTLYIYGVNPNKEASDLVLIDKKDIKYENYTISDSVTSYIWGAYYEDWTRNPECIGDGQSYCCEVWPWTVSSEKSAWILHKNIYDNVGEIEEDVLPLVLGMVQGDSMTYNLNVTASSNYTFAVAYDANGENALRVKVENMKSHEVKEYHLYLGPTKSLNSDAPYQLNLSSPIKGGIDLEEGLNKITLYVDYSTYDGINLAWLAFRNGGTVCYGEEEVRCFSLNDPIDDPAMKYFGEYYGEYR
jgi:hypothetical protein